MKTYDFNKVNDRHHTHAMKTDMLKEFYGREDLIPLWVADMDFETPDFIINALRKRLDHPVLGYQVLPMPNDFYPTICQWEKYLHHWDIKEDWVHFIPGIVKGLGLVVNVFTQPGDKVLIQPPVYHPFRLVPEGNGREVIYNSLIEKDGWYEMDFDDLETKLKDERCKLMVLCNPHNPIGIVWPKETLQRVAELCAKHHVLVVADEIHGEIIMKGHHHYPFASVCEAAAQNSITFQAPSKTFNIAGVVSSYSIVPNDEIREKFYNFINVNELGDGNIFSFAATLAAYNEGKDWLKQMVDFIESNADYVVDYLAQNIPVLKVFKQQSSFLMWLDCRGLKMSQEELRQFMVNEAHIAMSDGAQFGHDGHSGNGFMRMNIGTPRPILTQALNQLRDAVNRRNA